MNDRAVSLLEQYEIEVQGTRKGRGAILCSTDRGCLIFKEYVGNDDKIMMQNRLLTHIRESNKVQVEQLLPTKEGALSVRDGDGTVYILKTYCEGRECNIYDKTECLEAVRLLARLHECMELPADIPGLPAVFSPLKEYEKRNRELKRVRKFLQKRSQKAWFEICLLNAFDYFLEQALSVTEQWQDYQILEDRMNAASDKISYCHGDYQYHNIMKGDQGWFLINFEKCIPDNPIRDLYLLLRKLLEKSNWSVSLGRELLSAYEREQPIAAGSRIDLYYRLAYPEKFWKIVNFYYNTGKAWIPQRNQEKLEKLIAQEKEKQHFLDVVFRNL